MVKPAPRREGTAPVLRSRDAIVVDVFGMPVGATILLNSDYEQGPVMVIVGVAFAAAFT